MPVEQDGTRIALIMQIAVNPYKLLGVSKLAPTDTVLKAFDDLVSRPPDLRLSQVRS